MTLADRLSQDDLLELLRRREVPRAELIRVIVKIAKPFDQKRIRAAATIVAEFLNDPDPTVRHEAIWFLGSWGKLEQFTNSLIRVMKGDSDVWNRAYAARCLGALAAPSDKEVTRALIEVALDPREEDEVRSSAYGALLVREPGGQPGPTADDFQLWQTKGVSDFDYEWLKSINTTI